MECPADNSLYTRLAVSASGFYGASPEALLRAYEKRSPLRVAPWQIRLVDIPGDICLRHLSKGRGGHTTIKSSDRYRSQRGLFCNSCIGSQSCNGNPRLRTLSGNVDQMKKNLLPQRQSSCACASRCGFGQSGDSYAVISRRAMIPAVASMRRKISHVLSRQSMLTNSSTLAVSVAL